MAANLNVIKTKGYNEKQQLTTGTLSNFCNQMSEDNKIGVRILKNTTLNFGFLEPTEKYFSDSIF